jgi:transposase-like protein
VKVKGKWCYLYRAIDADGNLVNSRLSEKRDMEAAQQFFKQALALVGHTPERVTTDGHTSYPRAVREILGDAVHHRSKKYLNNRLEQDHRGIRATVLSRAWRAETSTQPPVSALRLTNCATIFAHVSLWENQPHAQNSGTLFLIGSPF